MSPPGSRSYARFLLAARLIGVLGALALIVFDYIQGYWLGVAFWTLALIIAALSWVFGVGTRPRQPPPEASREH